MSKVVLNTVIDIISGGTPKTNVPEYWNGDIGWLSVTDFNNDLRYVYDSEKTITELGVKESNTKFLNKGDVIISARGTVGALAQIGKPMCFNQSCFGLRGKEGVLDTDFLYYSLKNYVKNIVKRSQGSVFDTINLSSFNLMEIEIPTDLQNQQQIAKVLSDLDAKIELNNKINAELEAMAKLIYDYWFVQFEFPCLPPDYRPSGQVNPNSELSAKIKAFCTYKQTGGLPLPDGKKWFVYVLLCNDGSFYKGITNDLYRRYYEHGTGQGAQHTKVNKPLRVIHWEEFDDQESAALREKELKSGFGRTWLQREFDYLQNQKTGLPAHQFQNNDKPGLPAHNARQSKLMPAGKMVWNTELKREIPEGWEVGTIGHYCKSTGGFAFKSNWWTNKGTPVVKIKDIQEDNTINLSDLSFVDLTDKSIDDRFKSKPGDILIAMTGATVGKFGIVPIVEKPLYINQRVGYFNLGLKPLKRLPFFINSLNQKYFREAVFVLASGAAQPNISNEQINNIQLLIPDNIILERFNNSLESNYRKILINQYQNQKLAELRDWLLPMLMNGQVKVSER